MVLGSKLRRQHYKNSPRLDLHENALGTKNYFYDINPYMFSFILDSYRYGTLHLPHDICSCYLQTEIDCWEIPVDALRPCCFKPLYGDDDFGDIEFIGKTFPHLSLSKGDENCVTEVPCKSTVLTVWKLYDDAKSSKQELVSRYYIIYYTFLRYV